MMQVAHIEGILSPAGEEPVLHEAMVLISRKLLGLAVNIVRSERRDAGGFHLGVTQLECGSQRALDVGAHFIRDCLIARCLSVENRVAPGLRREAQTARMFLEAAPNPG